jgi:hypothetical protein
MRCNKRHPNRYLIRASNFAGRDDLDDIADRVAEEDRAVAKKGSVSGEISVTPLASSAAAQSATARGAKRNATARIARFFRAACRRNARR